MANHQKQQSRQRTRRRFRVRNSVRGTSNRPRLHVFRSSKHIYCQLIDDEKRLTIASCSTREAIEGNKLSYGGNVAAAEAVGKTIAEKGRAAGISEVRFDRGAFKYHGRVAALANAAREGGLVF
ncbi:MAG: 50S ribosomal protein L18 [Pirellulaceae bacterium]|nr:50S ribosomal protein L18 [Pirellulaceae bacterium]